MNTAPRLWLSWVVCLLAVTVAPAVYGQEQTIPLTFETAADDYEPGDLGDVGIVTDAPVIRWDLTAAPPGAKFVDGGRRLIFPTKTPGTYTLFVAASKIIAEDGKPPAIALATASKKITIKSASPAPGPAPPVAKLETDLRAILTGPTAAADALKLAELCRGVADSFRKSTGTTYGEFDKAWKAARDAVDWPAARYAGLPALLRDALPMRDETLTIDPAARALLLANLQTLQTTAERISKE